MFLTLRSAVKRSSIRLLRRLPLAAAVLGRVLPCVRPAGLAARLYVWLAQRGPTRGTANRRSAIATGRSAGSPRWPRPTSVADGCWPRTAIGGAGPKTYAALAPSPPQCRAVAVGPPPRTAGNLPRNPRPVARGGRPAGRGARSFRRRHRRHAGTRPPVHLARGVPAYSRADRGGRGRLPYRPRLRPGPRTSATPLRRQRPSAGPRGDRGDGGGPLLRPTGSLCPCGKTALRPEERRRTMPFSFRPMTIWPKTW